MNLDEAMTICRTAPATYTLDETNHAELYNFLSKFNFPSGARIVELGCCAGRTSLILAYLSKYKNWDFHAVDCFVLNAEHEYRQVMDNSKLPYTLHVNWTSSITVPTKPTLTEVPWDAPIHFLFIDASLNEPWFSGDCRKWIPFVVPGGIVAFDDWPGNIENGALVDNLFVDGTGAHDAIKIYGSQFTTNWIDLGWCGRVRIKQKPYDDAI